MSKLATLQPRTGAPRRRRGFTAADDQQRYVPAVARVTWKDEDESDGVPIGPARIWFSDGTVELDWQAKPDAIAYARRVGAAFEEV